MIDDNPAVAEQMPATIGRYQIQECIGEGAMGAVYKAFDPLIKRTLAIKTIRLDIPRSSPQYRSFIDRFYHEARISGTLNHPNIVTLFDIGEESGVPFLAMEYVAGDTIAAIIERGERFPPERVVGLVSQIASAIDYAHGMAIVHRDIKPSNLILSERDRVKVTDFGIAKLADTEITQTGQLLGTPSYMSPEQAMGEKLDGRSDIFSLGVCVFEMLSGEQPFPGANVTAILYKLVHVDPIEPENLEMEGLVPQKWREVFGKVLAKKPDDRYQTAAEFVQDLEYCLGSWFGAAMGEETLALPGAAGLTRTLSGPEARPPDATPLPASAGGIRAVDADDELPPTVAAPPSAARGRGDSSAAARAPAPVEDVTTLLAGVPQQGGDEAATVLMPTPSAKEPVAGGESDATVLLRPATPQGPGSGSPPPVPRPAGAAQPPARAAARAAATGQRQAPKTPVPARPAVPRPPGGLRPVVWVAGALVILGAVAVGLVALWKIRSPAPATASATPAGAVATVATPGDVLSEGFVRIATAPAGAQVTVNGEPRGLSPIGLSLPLGLYDVQVALEGYSVQARTVEITASNPAAELDLVLQRIVAEKALLEVISTPAGAEVTVDGRPSGATPLRGFEVTPGARRVEVAKAGYVSVRRNLTVRPGKSARIEVALEAVDAPPAALETPVPVIVDPNRIYLPAEVDTPPRKLAGDAPDSSGLPRKKAGQRVSVTVVFVVTETGAVGDVEVKESQAGEKFDELVVKTLRKWRFEPGVKAGVKVKVRETRKFTYQFG